MTSNEKKYWPGFIHLTNDDHAAIEALAQLSATSYGDPNWKLLSNEQKVLYYKIAAQQLFIFNPEERMIYGQSSIHTRQH